MYTVKTLPEFDKWLDRIKDRITRLRLSRRLDKAKRDDTLIIMLGGGDKDSQEKDIATDKEREATLED